MGARKRAITRSIRLRIAVLLLIPLISLVGLWAFAASITVSDSFSKFAASTTYSKIGMPASAMSLMLEGERASTMAYLATGGRAGQSQMLQFRAKTDATHALFEKDALSPEVRGASTPSTQAHMTEVLQRLAGLTQLRQSVDSLALTPLQALAAYDSVIDSMTHLFGSLVIVNETAIFQQGAALITMSQGRERILRQAALMTVAFARGGRMTAPEHTMFVQLSGQAHDDIASGLDDLTPPLAAPIQQVLQSPAYLAYTSMEAHVINSRPGRITVNPGDWQQATAGMGLSFAEALNGSGGALAQQALPIGQRIILRLFLAGGLGLVAVLASIVVSVLFARGLSSELVGLQRAAQELANVRLPAVVARLRKGEEIDVAVEVPPLRVGKTTEISRVAAAFSQVQRTAIESAVGEARLRKGISRVFLNLAWRSQSLLHRQLRMLDSLERRATEPEALEDLFRLDHLTTRMRRHSEGLVILSGAPLPRGWRNPVPIVDVLRGALTEVEEYTRVSVMTTSRALLEGAVVADIIHLIAELIENATAFSPPPTEVHVRGGIVANGYAVEIEDRGIGLSPEELAELNDRLAHPPEFDLADSERLGLFVVSRLAARHGIRITLQPSAYGGTTAIVLIPRSLVIDDRNGSPDPWQPQTSVGDRPTARRSLPGGQLRPGDADTPAEPAISTQPTGIAPYDPVFAAGLDATAPNGHVTEPVSTAWSQPAKASDPSVTAGPHPLPRRVRQANLAPQLREDAPASTGSVFDPPPPTDTRTPDQTRDRMSSLQVGWERGRHDAELSDPGPVTPRGQEQEWSDT